MKNIKAHLTLSNSPLHESELDHDKKMNTELDVL